ncbi:dockerin type I repeat-containing protein [Candidatus Fermentibacteria bacterium]|nr:dockerin type I repeat-containing protein [Candidatus Fermentibacteria bacterium]
MRSRIEFSFLLVVVATSVYGGDCDYCTYRFGRHEFRPSSSSYTVELLATMRGSTEGLSMAVRNDATLLRPEAITYHVGKVLGREPDFTAENIADTGVTFKIIFDAARSETLAPVENMVVGVVRYTILAEGAEPALEFVDGLGNPAVDNRAQFVDGEHSCCLGTVALHKQNEVFVRGDANCDAWVDVADPVYVISYLFGDEADPPCMDAADANDDGKIDVGDAISILSFLFDLGVFLPAPGPYPPGGHDLTDDALSCDQRC